MKRIIILFSSLLFLSCQIDNGTGFSIGYEDTSERVASISITDTLLKNVGNAALQIVEHTVLKQICNLRPIFRIPSVTVTNDGTILVACENREILADKGEIDILLSRKLINGSEWEIKKIMAQSQIYGRSMNPVFLIDRNGKQGHKGRVYLFACHIRGGEDADLTPTKDVDFVYKYSDDDGRTWSPEISLKEYWDTSVCTSIIPSAANGIQLEDGTFLLPTMIVKDGHWRSGLLYRQPHGRWTFSRPSQNVDDNECTVYIDTDEKIILDCRTFSKVRHRYIYDINKDEFFQMGLQPEVKVDLKAEIHRIPSEQVPLYLMSFVDTPTNKRENISLFCSKDAYEWRKVYRIQEGHVTGSYSNVATYNDILVVAYETGDDIRVQDASILMNSLRYDDYTN